MKKKILIFNDCHCVEQLSNHVLNVVRCGGIMISKTLYGEEKMAMIVAGVPAKFIQKFNETDSFQNLESFIDLP